VKVSGVFVGITVEFADGNKLAGAHDRVEAAVQSAREAEQNWGWTALRVRQGTKVLLAGPELRKAIDG